MKLSYEQARESVYRIYTKAGYYGGEEIIGMLFKSDLITLADRSKLMEVITSLEEYEIKCKQEKKFMNKAKKVKKV